MKVSERMTEKPVTVDTSATAKEVARIMKEENIGTVLVTEGDRLKGIATDRQIATKVVAVGKDPEKTRVSEFMTEDPVTASPDMIICEAAEIMGENGFRRIPVVENQKVVGILSAADVAIHARTCNACMENLFSEVEKAITEKV
jgi:CBS domain-containing protein